MDFFNILGRKFLSVIYGKKQGRTPLLDKKIRVIFFSYMERCLFFLKKVSVRAVKYGITFHIHAFIKNTYSSTHVK